MAGKAKVTRKQIDEMIETCIDAVQDGTRQPPEERLRHIQLLKRLGGYAKPFIKRRMPMALRNLLEARKLGLIKDGGQLDFIRAANKASRALRLFHILVYAGVEGHFVDQKYREFFGDDLGYAPHQKKIDKVNEVLRRFPEALEFGRKLELCFVMGLPADSVVEKIRANVDPILGNKPPVKLHTVRIKRKK